MIESYLSRFDLKSTVSELQMSKAEKLIQNSKSVQAEYRRSVELNKRIYDLAWAVLEETLGEDGISLPIDVRRVADVLGFTVSSDDFSAVELEYILNDHDCLPIAQLKMRRKLFGRGSEKICGTISVAAYLNENAKRFSIAHELGHFVLRHQNPIGSFVILDACPGMYPLVNTEEMLADVFAYALLLPYELFKKEREEYESDRTHWPLDFSMWISYIRDKAQIPEYHAVIACQEIKKRDIFDHMEKAEAAFKEYVLSMAEDGAENDAEDCYPAVEAFYAKMVSNLEGWGFSSDQVADILFRDLDRGAGAEGLRLKRETVAMLQDCCLKRELEESAASERAQEDFQALPSSVIHRIVEALKRIGMSAEGIRKVTGFTQVDIELSLEDAGVQDRQEEEAGGETAALEPEESNTWDFP